MENKYCQFCECSYMAGDEIKCKKHEILTLCNDYELAEYFAKEMHDYVQELKEGNR